MLFTVIGMDRPDRAHLRVELRDGHLKHLESNASMLRLAGPFLSDEVEQRRIGSLLIVEAENLQAAQDFVSADPYTKAGLFIQTEVRPFIQAIPKKVG